MRLKESIQTYRLLVQTQTSVKNKMIEEKWERHFKICYIGDYKGNHRFQILTLKLDYNSSVPMPDVYFQKRIASVFNILSVQVSSEGEIKQINNLDFLFDKAEELIKELRIDHKGGYFEEYLTQFSDFLHDQEQVINYLIQDNMFGLLFHEEIWSKNILYPSNEEEFQESLSEQWTVVEIGGRDTYKEESISPCQSAEISYKGKAYFKKNRLYELHIESKEKSLITEYNMLWIG